LFNVLSFCGLRQLCFWLKAAAKGKDSGRKITQILRKMHCLETSDKKRALQSEKD
jgi:hypothetical protein